MIKNIVFDFGGVLIDWNPRYMYRKYLSEEQMDYLLGEICTPEWNEEQDAGRSLEEGTEVLLRKHPSHARDIKAYYDRWEEMLGGVITKNVDLLKSFSDHPDYEIYGLTNWSAETFPIALERYDFLSWFKGIIVSGQEGTRKPFDDIYLLLLFRYGLVVSECLFIDDNKRNILAAQRLGFQTIHCTSADQVQQQVKEMKLLER